MIKYIEGDLFTVLNTENNIIIPHVCNCKGAFAAGFAAALAKHFPVAKGEYINWYKNLNSGLNKMDLPLGDTQFVQVNDNLFVANMVAQTLGGPRPLFYNHLASAMDKVAEFCGNKYQIICPLFGSGLAGGDHNFIEQLIIDCWLRKKIPVTIYYLPGQFIPSQPSVGL